MDIQQHGLSLIELLIAVAVIAMLTAIAIPMYQGYLSTSANGAAQANLSTLRLFLENHFLEHNTYLAGSYNPTDGTDDLTAALGWQPEGDDDKYVYRVTACEDGTIAECYTLTVTHIDGTGSATFTR